MKLVHPILQEPIIFSENVINVLIIENPNIFSNLVNEMFQQVAGIDGNFVFSKNSIPIDCTKSIEILFNIFELDVNCKKIINKLYNQLSKNAMDEDNYLKALNIKGQIINYIDELCGTEIYDITYSPEFDISGIFKLADVKLESTYSSLIEKIINYISVSYEFFHYECFVFVNLKNFLSKQDLEKLYNFINYNKFNMLLMENYINKNKIDCEKFLIIDDDMCII